LLFTVRPPAFRIGGSTNSARASAAVRPFLFHRDACDYRDERFRLDDRLRGTFAPALRASDKPIAIACLRLVTRLPERPLLSVPCFRSCIARFTLL
jgi:hypothetical protein